MVKQLSINHSQSGGLWHCFTHSMDFIFDGNVVAPLSQEASPAAYSAALISPMSSQSYATQQSKNTAGLRDHEHITIHVHTYN